MIIATLTVGSLVGLLLAVALIGVIAWAIVTFIPMPAPFKTLVVAVAGIVAILVILRAFGLLGGDLVLVSIIGNGVFL